MNLLSGKFRQWVDDGTNASLKKRLVWGVRFRRLVLILMLVSIGLRHRIGVASKIPFYLLSSIYSSFAKLWCEYYGETQWEGKYPLPVSSTKRYFKMQSIHGPSVYRTVPSAQSKPQQDSMSSSISEVSWQWGRWLQLTFFSFLRQNVICMFCTRRRSFGYCLYFPWLEKN